MITIATYKGVKAVRRKIAEHKQEKQEREQQNDTTVPGAIDRQASPGPDGMSPTNHMNSQANSSADIGLDTAESASIEQLAQVGNSSSGRNAPEDVVGNGR